MSNNKKNFPKGNSSNKGMFRGALLAFGLKIFAAGLGFFLNVVLARVLGAEELGVYFLSFTIITICATISRFGLDNTLVRFIASSIAIGDWGFARQIYKKSIVVTIVISVFSSFLLFISIDYLSYDVFGEPQLAPVLQVMVFAILPIALSNIHAQALKGLEAVGDFIAIISIWIPLFTLFFVLLVGEKYGVVGTAVGFVFSAYLAFFISVFRWFKKNAKFSFSNKSYVSYKDIFRSSIPLFWVSVCQLIITWSSTLIVGAWVASEDLGVFNAAYRTAMMTSFVLVAVNSIAAPKFASLYKLNKIQELDIAFKNTTRIMIGFSGPILLAFLVYPELIMSVYGNEFIQGSHLLSILSIGQFINVATGSVGVLLMMSGHERIMRNILLISATTSVLFSLALIPNFGVTGAAIATAITLSLQNLLALVLVRKYLGLYLIKKFIN